MGKRGTQLKVPVEMCTDAKLVTECNNFIKTSTDIGNNFRGGHITEEEYVEQLEKARVRREEVKKLIQENVDLRCQKEHGKSFAEMQSLAKKQAKKIKIAHDALEVVHQTNEEISKIADNQNKLSRASSSRDVDVSAYTIQEHIKSKAAEKARRKEDLERKKIADAEKKAAAEAERQKKATDKAAEAAKKAAEKAKAAAEKAKEAAEKKAAEKAKAAKSAEEAAEKATEAAEKEAEKAKAAKSAEEAAEIQANEAAEKATEAEESSDSSGEDLPMPNHTFKVGDKVQCNNCSTTRLGETVGIDIDKIRHLKIDFGTRHGVQCIHPAEVHLAAGE